MENRILLTIISLMLLGTFPNDLHAQTGCELICPGESVAVNYTSEDGYVIPDFFVDETVGYPEGCSEGTFSQSPAAGTLLLVGEYVVSTSLQFNNETDSCNFNLIITEGTSGGGKCVVVCPEYLYVDADTVDAYTLPNFFLDETIFIGGCELSNVVQSPAAGTSFDGDSLEIHLNYTVDGVDGNCTFMLVLDYSTDINSPSKSSIVMYPNPAKNKVHIDSPGKITKIIISDITGKQVMTAQTEDIDVSLMNKGLYFVEIATSEGMVMKRLVVE